jgi:hypothetical protein
MSTVIRTVDLSPHCYLWKVLVKNQTVEMLTHSNHHLFILPDLITWNLPSSQIHFTFRLSAVSLSLNFSIQYSQHDGQSVVAASPYLLSPALSYLRGIFHASIQRLLWKGLFTFPLRRDQLYSPIFSNFSTLLVLTLPTYLSLHVTRLCNAISFCPCMRKNFNFVLKRI